VARVYPFGPDVAPQGSYLNDIRFTPDGQRAVLTNSGQPGCLLTLDVASGAVRRVLVGHPSTQFAKGLVVRVNGRALERLDGETAQFSADGIAIDTAGEWVYWQATTGTVMYRAPVRALFDAGLSAEALGGAVETVGQTFVADGYWMSRSGTLFLTSCADNAVKRMAADKSFSVAVRDPRLLWPDSLAEGKDGTIFVTASHIPEMKAWQGPGVKETALFRFRPG
jgi:sugar lactone lactonase YvrE